MTECERVDLTGSLTPAVRRVLDLLAHGYSTQAIADELCIEMRTVRSHLLTIYETFGTSNHIQIALLYYGLPCPAPFYRKNMAI